MPEINTTWTKQSKLGWAFLATLEDQLLVGLVPAVISPNGHKEYYIWGDRHREDGPTVIYYDGSTEFWLDGQRQDKDPEPHAMDDEEEELVFSSLLSSSF